MTSPARRAVKALARPGVALIAVGVGLGATSPQPAHAVDRCVPEAYRLIDETPYAVKRLAARRLWERATGRGVVVAVVDSGVNAGNPHLKGAVLPGISLLPKDPDRRGWTDETGHGTAIAGVIAAGKVTGSGVIGLAPNSKILPVRVFVSGRSDQFQGGPGPSAERIAGGIRWAADHGARIINVSLSTPQRSAQLDTAVAYASTRGALVVASAGNREQGADKTDGPRYPAASDRALGVAAATTDDVVTDDSTHGPQVDVAAPGQSVLTTFHDAGDCLLQPEGASTSFATGYVSAAAALLAEAYPRASPDEIAYRLMASADRPVRGQRDDVRGWGLIRPYEALTMTIDRSRVGPPLPGQQAQPSTVLERPAPDLESSPEPLDEPNRAAAWWLFGGASSVAFTLLLSRWTAGP